MMSDPAVPFRCYVNLCCVLASGLNSEEAMPKVTDVLLPAPPSPVPEGPLLSEKLERLRTLEDMEAIETEEVPLENGMPEVNGTELQQPPEAESSPKGGKTQSSKKKTKRKALIDLKAVLAQPLRPIQCPFLPSAVQDEVSTIRRVPSGVPWIRKS